jgi:glycerophosphoryl diester phosphodiesterase
MSSLLVLVSPCAATEIVAHRGYSAKAPENTVAAFNLAWEAGTDACELDLYLTKDGGIILLHDKDTKRTTGQVLVPATSTVAELQKLDAGAWKARKYQGEKLPTLQEALATMPKGKQRFFLEIKCKAEVVPALTAALEPMKDRSAQLAIICFDYPTCVAAKKAMPWIKVYLLADGKDNEKKPRTDVTPFIKQAQEAGLDGLDLGANWPWNEAFVKQIRDAGLEVYVWTVDDPEKAKMLAELGIDGITTNEVTVMRAALKQ